MSFQNNTIEELWNMTRGSCMICGKKLFWKNKEKKGARGAWKVGQICSCSSKGYVFSNCEIDCLECYEKTRVKS